MHGCAWPDQPTCGTGLLERSGNSPQNGPVTCIAQQPWTWLGMMTLAEHREQSMAVTCQIRHHEPHAHGAHHAPTEDDAKVQLARLRRTAQSAYRTAQSAQSALGAEPGRLRSCSPG